MADPLSPATRATKRNLLVVAVLAISANAFNVSVDKIPIGGLSITFDDRLFSFLLFLTLVYFLCTFILYYVIDIKNIEPTAHQTRITDAFHMRTNNFSQSYKEKIESDLRTLVPIGYLVVLNPDFQIQLIHPESNTAEARYSFRLLKAIPGFVPPRYDGNNIAAQEEPLAAKVTERIRYWTDRFESSRENDFRRAQIRPRATEFMYAIRNYFFDGILPIALGAFALIAILGHIDLHWIQSHLPSFKTLSSQH